MPERRYTDPEAAEIFRRAAELEQAPPPHLAGADGLTLRQLEEIGREAGMSPELVARAARELVPVAEPRQSHLLGVIPIGVTHAVELHRHVTEAEWQDFVGELRATFHAVGRVREDGAFRQWSNGALHVVLEPTADGHRLRMQTRNTSSQSLLTAGTMTVAGASAIPFLASLAAVPDPSSKLLGAGVLGMLGIGMALWGALPLPGWASRRRAQMRALAARLASPTGDRQPPSSG